MIKEKRRLWWAKFNFFRVKKLSFELLFSFYQRVFHVLYFLLHLWDLKYSNFCNVTYFSISCVEQLSKKNELSFLPYAMPWLWLRGELWGLLLKAITLFSIWLICADKRESKAWEIWKNHFLFIFSHFYEIIITIFCWKVPIFQGFIAMTFPIVKKLEVKVAKILKHEEDAIISTQSGFINLSINPFTENNCLWVTVPFLCSRSSF